MTIYVVRHGDSLYSISQKFGISMDIISSVNKLYEIPSLVIGQALVIPTTETVYVVQPGDSLWSIGRKFGINYEALARYNRIPYPYILQVGMTLRIPEASKNFGYIEVNGFIEPSTTTEEVNTVNEVGRYLTYISPFSYQVNADGTINDIEDSAIRNTASNYNVASLMVITNFSEGNFRTELAHTILTNNDIQQKLIDNVLATMKDKKFYGLNIDFERVLPADRELYNSFLRKMAQTLHNNNYVLSTSLAPKISATQVGEWYEAHDYPAHGEIVDFVIIMTYEWGWSGGPPMAVAPINSVKKVLDYAVSVIPPKKIIMGMPLYGYDWKLPYVPGGPFAARVSPQKALSIASNYGSIVKYDQVAQSPFFNYYDENKVNHVVWFEDARSVRVKFLTAVEYGLRGVSYWLLGQSFPQNWAVLDDMFNIVKVL
ncbi:MAG: glycosyl hydrolase family 18 protein [Bacillota bacterium]|nr:glycosyl hydrolase family 18 protein [Bacillota bacterium]